MWSTILHNWRSLWRLQVGPLTKCRRSTLQNESVAAYLELFVTANDIKDDKLVPTLLTVVGSAHYTLLRGLVASNMPKDLTFDQLKEMLTKHFDPEPILLAKRFCFYQRKQSAGEAIRDYLAGLMTLRKYSAILRHGTSNAQYTFG